MTQTIKTKRRSRISIPKIISMFFGVSALVMSVLFISGFVNEVIVARNLKAEMNSVRSQLDTLNTENANLATEKSKLEDPAYVQNYARGTHLLSKSGETVFILPKSE